MSIRRTRHAKNPFKVAKEARHEVIYCPDDYHISLLQSCDAMELRVITVIAAKYDHTMGVCVCPLPMLHTFINSHPTNIRNAIIRLEEKGIIKYAKPFGQYYLNPKIYRPVTIF